MPARDVSGIVPTLHALALPAGVALLVVAFYLERRRRNAWRAAVGLLVVLGVLNLLRGFELGEAALSFAFAGLLDLGPGRVRRRARARDGGAGARSRSGDRRERLPRRARRGVGGP